MKCFLVMVHHDGEPYTSDCDYQYHKLICANRARRARRIGEEQYGGYGYDRVVRVQRLRFRTLGDWQAFQSFRRYPEWRKVLEEVYDLGFVHMRLPPFQEDSILPWVLAQYKLPGFGNLEGHPCLSRVVSLLYRMGRDRALGCP